MSKKGIIFVTPWFGTFAGGAEVLVKTLAIELNKRGLEAFIFTTCSKSPYDSWWDDYYNPGIYNTYGLKTYRFATDKNGKIEYENVVKKIIKGEKLSINDKKKFFYCGINSRALVKKIKEFLDDYEIIALPYFHGLTHAVINAYPEKISIIPCFHDETQFYWSEVIAPLLKNAKNIFFNSHEEKEMTIRHYGLMIGRKVTEGIVTGVIVQTKIHNKESKKKGQGKELPRSFFVYVGRKEKGKNVHLLCEWFKYYKREFKNDTKLVFIGGGDRSLIPRSSDLIDYGYIPEEEKQFILQKAKGLITLSENESFSLVIMEAWLLGIPVIVSGNCAVTKGHVLRCNGGLYVSNKDEFIHALKFLEDNPLLAQKMGMNGRIYVQQQFNPETVLLRYLRVIK